jgi:hypothetical protein
MPRFPSIMVACALASAGCAGRHIGASSSAASETPTGFPVRCDSAEVRVMLLGTYHFANPGLDDVKQEVDDVLEPTRQREITDLVERLAAWRPEQIAVEWPASQADSIAARYARYRAGTLAPSRNEVVQIGFRLAHRLGLPSVEAIDYQLRIGNDSVGALLARRPDLNELSESAGAALQRASDRNAKAFAALSIVGQLGELNGDAALHAGNSRGMFGGMLPLGEGSNYGGPQVVARWYERNVMMVHLLYRSVHPSTRRVLVIVGAGHVPPMRNLLDEAPQFCPVSPEPFLRVR